MRKFCEALPADRLLQGNDCSLEEALVKEKSHRKYVDPESGATLTYASSLVVLAHFVGCLVSTLRSLIATVSNTCSHIVTRTSPTRPHIASLSRTGSLNVKSYCPKARLFIVPLGDLRPGSQLLDDRQPSKHAFFSETANTWTRI